MFAEIVNYRYASNESGIQMHCPELRLALKFEINQNPLKFTNSSKRVAPLFCTRDSKLILNAGGRCRDSTRTRLDVPCYSQDGKQLIRKQFYIPLASFCFVRDTFNSR